MVYRVSDCCLTTTQQLFSYIMAKTSQFTMRWLWGPLCTRPIRSVGFSIVLAHWIETSKKYCSTVIYRWLCENLYIDTIVHYYGNDNCDLWSLYFSPNRPFAHVWFDFKIIRTYECIMQLAAPFIQKSLALSRVDSI